MKCPVCQAKLLPVAGEMFCLQCGNVVPVVAGEDNSGPAMDETTDPLLQKAIVDAVQHEVHFRLPVSGSVPAPKTTAFNTMRQVLAPATPLPAGVGAAAMPAPIPATVVAPVVAPPAASPAPLAPAAAVPAVPVAEVKNGTNALNLFPVAEAGMAPQPAGKVERPGLPVAWMAGLAAFGLFLAVNAGIYGYYAERVYPGVKVGQVSLGGTPLGDLRGKLSGLTASAPGLTVEIAGSKHELEPGAIGGPDLDRLEREVRAVGRTTPLPMAGILWALASSPLSFRYGVDEPALKKTVAALVESSDHRSSDAIPLIVAGKAFVITQKSGSKLDPSKVEKALRDGFGTKTSLAMSPDAIDPLVQATAYKKDIESAQIKMSLNLKINVKSTSYTPTPQQIGEWLSFNGPGKGVTVDGSKVSGYVAGLPGKFDRVGATNALMAGLQNGQAVAYTASTSSRKVSSAPKLAAVPTVLPAQTYRYCLKAATSANELKQRAAAVMATTGDWALAGRLKYEQVQDDCNFTLQLASSADMANIGASCVDRASCLNGNVLAINEERWAKAPTEWKTGLGAYQSELITQELGHWLGFDRSGCLAKGSAPILEVPTLVLSGCSPSWYAIPPELQASKAFESF